MYNILDKLKSVFVRNTCANIGQSVLANTMKSETSLINVSKTDNSIKETDMNAIILLNIGNSILSIVKQVEALQATANGADKKGIAMIFIKEAYNDAGLDKSVGSFDSVAAQIGTFVDTAVAIYNALGKFVSAIKSS